MEEDYISKLKNVSKLDFQSKVDVINTGRPTPELKGADRMCDAVQLMTGQRPWGYFTLCWRYFTPLLCMVCFFGFFLNHQPLTTSGGYMYPDWAYGLGWAMALSSVVAVPIWAVVKICLTEGTLRQRLSVLCRPVVDHVDPVDPELIKERGTEMKSMPAL